MKHFESFLAPLLNDYMTYRKNMGYSTKSSRSHLLIFDRYLIRSNADQNSLQPYFFLEMRANLHLEPRAVNSIITAVRVFFQFLLRRDYVAENPLRDIPFLKENIIIPFLFSPEQTDQLLEVVCKSIGKRKDRFLTDFSLYIAMLLLARCGVRISEPLRLLRHHYRRDDGTVYIEKTKFKKDRLLALPKALITEIENYLSVRKSLSPDDQSPYLLAGKNQRPLTAQNLRYLFHKVVKDIGLDQPRRVIGNLNFSQPTPHSLRHSFAVNTLIKIKARGESPQHALPVLAAYMGHRIYQHTSVYLKVAHAISRKKLYDFALWQEF